MEIKQGATAQATSLCPLPALQAASCVLLQASPQSGVLKKATIRGSWLLLELREQWPEAHLRSLLGSSAVKLRSVHLECPAWEKSSMFTLYPG